MSIQITSQNDIFFQDRQKPTNVNMRPNKSNAQDIYCTNYSTKLKYLHLDARFCQSELHIESTLRSQQTAPVLQVLFRNFPKETQCEDE